MDGGATDRSHLLKAIPDSIPALLSEFDKTHTSDQDQLLLTSLSIELAAAGLDWCDLANIVRYQLVAHRVASMKGVINAARAHPNKHRLSEWELKFLNDIHRRARLLTERQMACLQSITDSLDLSDDDFALRVLARVDEGDAA